MVKQNASLDASFWINACAGNIIEFTLHYFYLFAPSIVAEEIRYPLHVLGMQATSSLLFNQWVGSGKIMLQEPNAPVDWFQQGENAAIALAVEQNYFLLMDDANPYHRAKSMGLNIIGTAEFTILLFDQGHLTYAAAVDAIKQARASKPQKRKGLTVLESLARRKGKLI